MWRSSRHVLEIKKEKILLIEIDKGNNRCRVDVDCDTETAIALLREHDHFILLPLNTYQKICH